MDKVSAFITPLPFLLPFISSAVTTMGVCLSTPSTSPPPFSYEGQLHSATSPLYSVIVNPSDPVKGETHTRRHPVSARNGLCTAIYPEEQGGLRTIWDGFQRGVRVSGANPCLGTRPYQLNADGTPAKGADGFPTRLPYVWSSYAEVDVEARELGIGLALLGYEPQSNVGIFSKNRHEWIAVWLGLISRSMRVVALYDTLGPDAVQFIIQHADTHCLFVDVEKLPALLAIVDTTHVRHVVQFDANALWANHHEAINPAHKAAFAAHNVTLLGYSELRAMARTNTTIFPVFPKPDDLAYIMYTSGTTGNPKGAILTHGGLCASVEASRHALQFDHTDIHLSYLPLAHIFETGVQVVFLSAGARIGFSTGIIKKMTDDLVALRPTCMFGVPRVFQRIHQVVFANIEAAGGLKRRVALNSYESQVAALRRGEDISHSFVANKVFGAIRTRVGLDRCRQIATAAAPCPPYIMEFLAVVIGASVVQGYGMTETHCVISSSYLTDVTRGHVGGPMQCSEIKLVDIEEMNYTAADRPLPRGEIWVRGPQLFKGYWKDEEQTRESLKEGGWLATGDVGRWNENGSLSIIDRRKNIFKLSQGEYVAAERIEGIYSKSAAISACFVYGNSFKCRLHRTHTHTQPGQRAQSSCQHLLHSVR